MVITIDKKMVEMIEEYREKYHCTNHKNKSASAVYIAAFMIGFLDTQRFFDNLEESCNDANN